MLLGNLSSTKRWSPYSRLVLRMRRAFAGKEFGTYEIQGVSKDRVLTATVELAAQVRKAVGDDAPEALRLATAKNFAGVSIDAAHAYAVGTRFRSMGKRDE